MVDGETAILLVALLAAFTFAGLVFALLYPYVSGEKQTEKRVASVTETRAKKARRPASRSAADIAAQRKKQVSESLKDMESRAKSREKVSIANAVGAGGPGRRAARLLDIQSGVRSGSIGGHIHLDGRRFRRLDGGRRLASHWHAWLCRAGSWASSSSAARRNSSPNLPMPSTSSCAASNRVCRSMSACRSSRARALSRLPVSSATSWSRCGSASRWPKRWTV